MDAGVVISILSRSIWRGYSARWTFSCIVAKRPDQKSGNRQSALICLLSSARSFYPPVKTCPTMRPSVIEDFVKGFGSLDWTWPSAATEQLKVIVLALFALAGLSSPPRMWESDRAKSETVRWVSAGFAQQKAIDP